MLFASAIDNIRSADGFSIALTGILIVFFVLILISVFLECMPKLIQILNDIMPEKESHPATATAPQAAAGADEELAAAIGIAFHVHQGEQK